MRSPEYFPGRAIIENQILLPSATREASGTGDEYLADGGWRRLWLALDVDSAADDALDALDVFVQTTIDGTNWIDIAHFSQVAGNDSPSTRVLKVSMLDALTEFEASASLAAGNVRSIFGAQYRARWEITDNTGNASFTFSVTGAMIA